MQAVRTDGDSSGAADRETTEDWAPLVRSPNGIDEIDPAWLAAHASEVCILDVREPDEYFGPLGHVAGAVLIPLGELATALAQVPTDRPIVTACLAGGRSAYAFVLLKRAGFDRVANLTGGMALWHERGLPVVRGS